MNTYIDFWWDDSFYGDFIPLIMCNALNVKINVLARGNNELECIMWCRSISIRIPHKLCLLSNQMTIMTHWFSSGRLVPQSWTYRTWHPLMLLWVFSQIMRPLLLNAPCQMMLLSCHLAITARWTSNFHYVTNSVTGRAHRYMITSYQV